jgi:myo-inositol-1(or 4)-monophosphatase
LTISSEGSRLLDREKHNRQVASVGLLAIARSAALAVTDLLCSPLQRDDVHRKPGGLGLVTTRDLDAERGIRQSILSRRPNDEVVGEELGRTSGHSGVVWIVDPIDGTNNYVAGLPDWSVSIAVQVNGRMEAAVVHVPSANRTYTALAGRGSWCNGLRLPLRSAHTDDIGDAIVATGFAPSGEGRLSQLQQLTRVLGVVRDVRCHGAASTELCRVAAGEIDAYYESDLSIWDVAAGALVAIEAGVEVSGDPWSGDGTLVAGSLTLVPQLRRLIALTCSSEAG